MTARPRGEEKRAWERTMRLYDKLRTGGSPNAIDRDDNVAALGFENRES